MKTKHIALGLVAFVALLVPGCWVLNHPYSEGHRTGYLQKFSKKGLVIKTWEGDLALMGSARSNAVGNVWHFSVDDPAVVEQLNNVDDVHPVRLTYIEYLWSGKCSTNYRVTKVDTVLAQGGSE